jgi:cyclic beta-1,2-glucan synthetase
MTTTAYLPFDPGELPALPAIVPREDKKASDVRSMEARSLEHGCDTNALRASARECAQSFRLCEARARLTILAAKWKRAEQVLGRTLRELSEERAGDSWPVRARILLENSVLVRSVLGATRAALTPAQELPQVSTRFGKRAPRAYVVARSYLDAVERRLDEDSLLTFLEAMQAHSTFTEAEIWTLRPFLQLALLEHVAGILDKKKSGMESHTARDGESIVNLVRSLRSLGDIEWKEVHKTLSSTEKILCDDPQRAYASMDAESRQGYRQAVTELASHSAWTEAEIAREAVKLARRHEPVAGRDKHARARRSHVGYYLVGDGQRILKRVIGYKPKLRDQLREAIVRWPGFFYLASIALGTAAISAIVFPLLASSLAGAWKFAAMAVFILPIMESAITVSNLLLTRFIPPAKLPRLDFSRGIPPNCRTLVAVPILLMNEEQVRQAARDLEIRFIGNRDHNLYFALVTDLPDSTQSADEKDALAGVCSQLIVELNSKYRKGGRGPFLHLHRLRTYNPTEGVWMGWERKRGKMLDLNNLLLDKADAFPIKGGDISALRGIRYVITLDQDTQLPIDAARKLVGTLAHPLNRAVIDPVANRVVEGYAILQPKVAISIKAKGRSRLAAICSGDTGLDLYTRAVSDVYQDLFGEGIYTGKGIYEVETFQRVLEDRLPCNAILSHDLIEGAYARAALVSDIEVTDDYPSHIRAYSRRKHRWVRGDWQIIRWLFPKVPDSSGGLVPNPLKLIARWQIADNLRRSLGDVALFALLLIGWLVLPVRALLWTAAALALMALPMYLEFLLSVAGAGRALFTRMFWENTASDLASKHVRLCFRLVLLFHQSLVTFDAVVRALIRMTVTHKRLLEWETAAQAELETAENNVVETYLNWIPWVTALIAVAIAWFRPASLPIALPALVLWGASGAICEWLSEPHSSREHAIGAEASQSLYHMALRNWRFFREFSTEEEQWLIPDVVQAEPPFVCHAISPTNLGLLLDARLAAHDLGFLTLSEFVTVSERTLEVMAKMPTWEGHFYNWYDTQTLAPKHPRFVSTIDNGNLVCSLWTLKQGCLELKHRSLFPSALWKGVVVHLHTIELLAPQDSGETDVVRTEIRNLRQQADLFAEGKSDSWTAIAAITAGARRLAQHFADGEAENEIAWWAQELVSRVQALEEAIRDFAPWRWPEYAAFCWRAGIHGPEDLEKLTLETLSGVVAKLDRQIAASESRGDFDDAAQTAATLLRAALSRAHALARSLEARLDALAHAADRFAAAHDFSLLYNAGKGLLSIGYDVEASRLVDCNCDLLASEARSAAFVAIAKGEIPQETWANLGRPGVSAGRTPALLSWTGTMFEYLMPFLWMKSYPDTLLEHAAKCAVRAQKSWAEKKGIPWGVSECSFGEYNSEGRYGYRAFGVPDLALSQPDPGDMVISPYSAFLALAVDAHDAIENLCAMEKRGWLGEYGFYDACDFSIGRVPAGEACKVVRCWMAHHQGMSLAAAANALGDSPMQRRFHAEPMVAATERLLQENPRNIAVMEHAESPEFEWPRVLSFSRDNLVRKTLSVVRAGLASPSDRRIQEIPHGD